MRLFLFLCGATDLSVAADDVTEFTELCRVHHVTPNRVWREKGSDDLHLTLETRAAGRLLSLCGELEGVRVIKTSGLPHILGKAARRPGLLLGCIFALLLITLSHLFVWEIRVEGCESIPTEELFGELSAVGLREGSFIPLLDGDSLAAALRAGDARIAYASVHVKGTVARVQVRESNVPEKERELLPANLVARCDGVITAPLVFEGEVLVREGETVRAGQLLAGGLIDTEAGGIRMTRAAGQVFARTVHTYEVRVPFAYEKKSYTGRKGREVSLFFFSFDRKVFKTTGNLSGNCDIIEKVNRFRVSDGRYLPFGYAETVLEEYTLEAAYYTAEEALAKANAELDALLEAESGERMLLQKNVEVAVDGEGITLFCTVIAEEDIARVVEFTVS